MSVRSPSGREVLAGFRPRRVVFIVMGLFLLLPIQYFAQVLLGIENGGPVVTFLNSLLNGYIDLLMWLLSPVPQSLLYKTAFAIPAVLVYSYLLATLIVGIVSLVASQFREV